ncbi:MAG: LacI family transcriptional regulator [Ruminococcus sp.]|nr:LacI family transcriptional regulator [Ruminococcus sp.]
MAATIKDIAKETGLGLATISSYLNGGNVREKNRQKIEAAIEELHFEVNEVARGLKTNKTKMVGIIIPELNNIFCAEIITEVEDILRAHGYATMICDCRTDAKREEEAVDFLNKRRVDGLILMPSSSSGKYLRTFMSKSKPVILLDRKFQDLECDSVLVDNSGAAKDAVRRLIQAGHEKIGIIAGPEDLFTAEERLAGYREGLKEAGIKQQESLVIRKSYTIAGGAAGMQALIEQNPDMTAVLASNYELTVGAVIEANELGIRVPEQLSFIGFDNLEFAKACVPKLSIVTQPTKEIGRQVAENMLQKLEGNAPLDERNHIKLKTGFVEGRTIRNVGK